MHLENRSGDKGGNSTWLFEGVTRDFRNGERWWSALLSMFILLNGRLGEKLRLTERRFREDDTQDSSELVLPSDISYQDVVCDGQLAQGSASIFGLDRWPEGLSQLRPDITVFLDGREGRKVLFLEVKTIGAPKDEMKQMENYLELCQLLRDSGKWDEARLIYVLSEGHEGSTEGSRVWGQLRDKGISFIYWEDVLREMQASPLASIFRGVSLASYIALPAN